MLEKLPAIADRLAVVTPRRSATMNSVRRMIKALADRIYPSSSEPVVVDGHKYDVGSDKVLNRLKLSLCQLP